MEAIHEEVTSVVRYTPAHRVDVLVIDPLSRANGAALPLLKRPRMILFTTPPSSRSFIGNYRDWSELLVAHEYVHITHLIKPPRNIFDRILSRILPIGPLSLRCPGWIVEGYATLLEGRLTDRGRPNGSLYDDGAKT